MSSFHRLNLSTCNVDRQLQDVGWDWMIWWEHQPIFVFKMCIQVFRNKEREKRNKLYWCILLLRLRYISESMFIIIIIICRLRSRRLQAFSNCCGLGLAKQFCLAAASLQYLPGGTGHTASTVCEAFPVSSFHEEEHIMHILSQAHYLWDEVCDPKNVVGGSWLCMLILIFE